ncbi:hypothetical protein JCM31447_11050 [Fluviispira sanaruensis]|uniref:Uncharacterized protein n=1 Tax=Fluviispira sanaruensis TaxID=2493639 RepID=A0A4P2VL53_FLUSA|nr:hypothetical protein JCM31447_11050 [Fluviispira sanaruensis]
MSAKTSTRLLRNFEKISPATKPENKATLFEIRDGSDKFQKGLREVWPSWLILEKLSKCDRAK